MRTLLPSETHYDLSMPHLKTGSIFGALSENAISYLLERGTLIEIKKGDEVFSYGSKGSSFYAVLHGRLDFHKHHNNKHNRTRTVHFGEAIAFVSMIALHERVGNLVALEDGLLLEISSQLFSDFHDDCSFDFGILLMNLSRDMARTIRILSNAIVENNVEVEIK